MESAKSGSPEGSGDDRKIARKPHKPRPATQRRREDILRAAMETFGAKGYYNGSLAEVAEKVGMTHTGVLHHFGSKDKLLTEVLQFRDDDDVAELEGHAAPTGLPLFDHLVDTARRNAKRPGIVQTYAVLSAESVTDDHPAREFFRVRFDDLRAMIARSLVMVCDPENMPSDVEISQAASAIIGVMDGLQVQWLLRPDAFDFSAANAFAIDAILAALIAGPNRHRVIEEST